MAGGAQPLRCQSVLVGILPFRQDFCPLMKVPLLFTPVGIFTLVTSMLTAYLTHTQP